MIEDECTAGSVASGGRCRSLYFWLAWASPAAGVVLAVILTLFAANQQGVRGERPPAVLLFYGVLSAAGAAGGLAGVVAFFGIRSWRGARSIIPGALLGVCINGCITLMALYAHALVGQNLGG
jgi:hypothetical protein